VRSKEEIKETGATFTPPGLANYLASLIVPELSSGAKILDPACGDGALLSAIDQVLKQSDKQGDLIGFDADEKYIEEAKNRMKSHGTTASFFQKDFLEHLSSESDDLFSENLDQGTYDAIIANPPYVRTQVLGAEKAQMLAKKFNLKGRVDLYYPFLIGMTQMLKEGGVIGVLTSNRYLSTKSGESIMKFLTENFDIIQVIDLGDTKLFDAAVLPAIFLGKKKLVSRTSHNAPASFIKIYEELNGRTPDYKAPGIFEVLRSDTSGCYTVEDKKFNLSTGVLRYDHGSKELWPMLTDEENEWVTQIESAAEGRIKDWFKARVGVKTTADPVFIKKDWKELKELEPEKDLIHTLISGDNVERWKLNEYQRLELLYTHYDNEGKKAVIDLDKYPKAASYLETHRERLEGRSYVIKAKRKWFEIWVPQNPSAWKHPKLVFPDISVESRFYLDTSGSIVNGNCYWIAAENKESEQRLKLIQGVANSSLMSTYHDLMFNNKLYSGRRRYFSQYVENYPVPKIDSKASKKIIKLVEKLNSIAADMNSEREKLDALVVEAFNL